MVKFISILKCFRKELNKEASKLTYEEKIEVLNKLFLQSYITKDLGDRFFEIISSMSYSEVRKIESQLKYFISIYPIKESIKYIKFLDINYSNVEEKLKLLSHYRLYPVELYRNELIMSVYKKITTQELKMVLDNCGSNEELTQVLLMLLKENIHTSVIDYYSDRLTVKKENLEEWLHLMQILPNDLRRIILFNNYCFRDVFKDDSKYSKYISKAEKDFWDKTFLYKTIDLIEDREYLSEYNELMVLQQTGKIKDNIYIGLDTIEKEKLHRLRALVEDGTPLANEFDSMIKSYESSPDKMEIEFNSTEEKIEYFINTPKALSRSYLFEDIADLITKEQIIEKIKNQKISWIPKWIKEKFTEEEFLELFKSYPNSFEEYAIADFCLTASAKNIMKCLEIFPNLKVKSLISIFKQIHEKDKGGNGRFYDFGVVPKKLPCHLLEVKEEIYAYIEKAIIRENYTTKSFILFETSLSELKLIKSNYPNLYKNLNYSFLGQELASYINYFEDFKDEKEFLNEMFEYYKNGSLDINIATKIICEMLNVYAEYEKTMMFSYIKHEDYKEIYQSLDNEKKLLFIKHMESDCSDGTLDYYLLSLEHGEEILSLYQTINETNRAKIERYDSDSHAVFCQRKMFKENIFVVVEYLEVLKKLVASNPTVLFTINYVYLDIFEGKDLEFFTRYEKRLSKLNDENKKVCKRIIKIIKNKSDFSEEFIDICLDKAEKFNDLEDLSDKELDKLIYYLVSNPYLFSGKSLVKEILRDIDTSKIELTERIIAEPSSDLEDIKNAILFRYFNLRIDKATRIVKEYESSLDELLKMYESKELSIEAIKEYKTLLYFKQIKNIINTDDKELLIMLYQELASLNPKEIVSIDNTDLLMLESTLKTIYTKELKSNLYRPNDADYKTTIDYQGSSIRVYEPTDEFNILMTVVGAYVKNSDAKANPKEDWNNEDKKINHGICTSLIAQDNLSMALLDKNPLIYGFYNIEDNSIQKEANYDLVSNSNSIQITAGKPSNFRITRNMVDNTRNGHSELVIERRTANQTKIEKRQPDFIIAISPISDLAKEASAQFNIPIVLLDIEKIAKREHDKLMDIMSQLSIEIDETLLSTFITKYHNNYTGYIGNFKKICKKYYNPKVFKKYFEKIVIDISNIEDEERRISLASSYLKFLNDEEEKRIYTSIEYIPFEFKNIKSSLEKIISKRELQNTPEIKKGI